MGHSASLASGQTESAEKLLDEIESLLRRFPWRYRDPEDRVVIGRFLLHRGADARQVLEVIYDPIKKERPDLPWAGV